MNIAILGFQSLGRKVFEILTAKKSLITIAITLGVLISGAAIEAATAILTSDPNPANLCTLMSFEAFHKNMEPSDTESFSAVSEFVKSNGKKSLFVECIPVGNDYHYAYVCVGYDSSLGKKISESYLKNWDAVRKYLYVENKIKNAKKNKEGCNLYNHGPEYLPSY